MSIWVHANADTRRGPPSAIRVDKNRLDVDTDGRFTVPDDVSEQALQSLRLAGHEQVSDDEPEPETEAADVDPVAGLTEEDIVTMDYRELQAIAADVDGIRGNATRGAMEEALIQEVRSR